MSHGGHETHQQQFDQHQLSSSSGSDNDIAVVSQPPMPPMTSFHHPKKSRNTIQNPIHFTERKTRYLICLLAQCQLQNLCLAASVSAKAVQNPPGTGNNIKFCQVLARTCLLNWSSPRPPKKVGVYNSHPLQHSWKKTVRTMENLETLHVRKTNFALSVLLKSHKGREGFKHLNADFRGPAGGIVAWQKPLQPWCPSGASTSTQQSAKFLLDALDIHLSGKDPA